ncbi:MAG: MATE family efflux transporter [Clostridia bacterium]|nr:MATE family efflux transporter [Clostridia bacterium]
MLKLAPPVMLAQLIYALYNIVDSFFVGRYSGDGLTALSVIFPIQLIITALAVGTGVGVNTYMARLYAAGDDTGARKTAGTGLLLALATWALFAVIAVLIMRPYVMTGTRSPAVIDAAVTYGTIVCVGSLGSFLEGIFSKVHQSRGNMRLPMIAQIVGAVTNMILDPVLIFGLGGIPALGVAGAAYATVVGQFAAAAITAFGAVCKPPRIAELPRYIKPIYKLGYPSILMQALYTVYIIFLNAILATFSDAAVTVLGLYYKMQSFFFIPINGLQTCIVPILSYNFARKSYERCKKIMTYSFLIALIFMVVGFVSFVIFPDAVISLFSSDPQVHKIGKPAFRIIGCSFFSAVFSLILPVFFQAIGKGISSLMLSLCRQIFCLLTLFYLFSLIGLGFTWIAFPAAETITGVVGLILYVRTLRHWHRESVDKIAPNEV